MDQFFPPLSSVFDMIIAVQPCGGVKFFADMRMRKTETMKTTTTETTQ